MGKAFHKVITFDKNESNVECVVELTQKYFVSPVLAKGFSNLIFIVYLLCDISNFNVWIENNQRCFISVTVTAHVEVTASIMH